MKTVAWLISSMTLMCSRFFFTSSSWSWNIDALSSPIHRLGFAYTRHWSTYWTLYSLTPPSWRSRATSSSLTSGWCYQRLSSPDSPSLTAFRLSWLGISLPGTGASYRVCLCATVPARACQTSPIPGPPGSMTCSIGSFLGVCVGGLASNATWESQACPWNWQQRCCKS